MDKIKRRHFTGSWLLFFLLCITGVGVPLAILYLIEGTLEIETDIPDAEAFMAQQFGNKPRW
jgi:hypothetical protein